MRGDGKDGGNGGRGGEELRLSFEHFRGSYQI